MSETDRTCDACDMYFDTDDIIRITTDGVFLHQDCWNGLLNEMSDMGLLETEDKPNKPKGVA